MTRTELLGRLREIRTHGIPGGDEQDDHLAADQALLSFIADREITEAFEAIPKWYA